MRYVILKSWDTSHLADQVNKHIEDGYVPLGGVGYNSQECVQAMYLKNSIPKDSATRRIEGKWEWETDNHIRQ